MLCKDEAFAHFLLISCSFVDAVVSTFSKTRQVVDASEIVLCTSRIVVSTNKKVVSTE